MGNSAPAGPSGGKVATKKLSKSDVASKCAMAGKTGTLSLTAAKLSSLPPDVFTLSALRKLDASYNVLVSVSVPVGAGWAALRNLRTLILSHNELTALPPVLADLPLLASLDVSHNRLTAGGVSHLPLSLEDLNLAHNALAAVPAPTLLCIKLTSLDISENPIAALPAGLTALMSLEVLSAHHCGLTRGIAPLTAFETMPALQSVDMSFNNMIATSVTLPPSLFIHTRMHRLHLAGNPITQLGVQGLEGVEAFIKRRKERIDKGLAADVGGAERLCGL